MKKVILLVLLLVAPTPSTPQQQSVPVATASGRAEPDRNSPAARLEAFNIVWSTVKEQHFDPTLGGVDWDHVREVYLPRVKEATTDTALYELLRRMLGELRQSHFEIIPPENLPDDVKEVPLGGVGVELRLINRLPVVTRVKAGTSGERAGLRPGFVIKAIDGVTVEKLLESFPTPNPTGMTLLRMTRRVLSRLRGQPGSVVRVRFLDRRDRLREVKIERERLPGDLSPAMGNLPPQYVEFESQRLSGGLGYVRFNVFAPPVMDRIRTAIRSLSDAPGLIIDLRGNPGGLAAISIGIAGLLTDRQFSLGTMKTRSTQLNFVAFPQNNAYVGPVAIMIDGLSASTSEVFASGMQESGRAVIVGERSAGAALPSIVTKLPTGALFQYAIADFKTPKGVLIEGRGVVPDVLVSQNRAALLGGRDPQLETTIQAIRGGSRREPARAARAGSF